MPKEGTHTGWPLLVGASKYGDYKQWYDEQSSTQLHQLGAKLVVDDGGGEMVFRYAHIAANAASAWRGRGMSNLGLYGDDGTLGADNGFLYAATITEAAAGATEITVTLSGAGGSNNITCAENELAGGYIVIMPAVWTGWIGGRIRSNTAAVAGVMTVTLVEGIQDACAAASPTRLTWNPYAYVGTPLTNGSAWRWTSVVGCLNLNATVDYYVWLQTWGPYVAQTSAYGTYDIGRGTHDRNVFFDGYGGFMSSAYMVANGHPAENYQRAGFVLANTYAPTETLSWMPLVMLQISP